MKPNKSSKVICRNCYDKKFYTVFKGSYGSADFIGDRGFEILPHVQKFKCPICNGRPREYARKQVKQMLIGVRNGGLITPVLHRIMELIK
jgi:hypothetical protein